MRTEHYYDPDEVWFYYDRTGQKISRDQWGRMHADDAYRTVARTQVGGTVVSTVWLGLNHAFRPRSAPIIFETMVFGGRMDSEMVRYSTEAQAWEGHAVMVGQVRAIQGEPVEVIHDDAPERKDW